MRRLIIWLQELVASRYSDTERRWNECANTLDVLKRAWRPAR